MQSTPCPWGLGALMGHLSVLRPARWAVLHDSLNVLMWGERQEKQKRYFLVFLKTFIIQEILRPNEDLE